jgi:hypothetical protein
VSERKPELRLVPADASTGGPGATVELIEAARRYLIYARSVPDLRSVMEMAAVAKDAARRAAKLAEARRLCADVVEAANEAANDAAAIRNEAQARAGELLKSMAEDGRRAERGRPEKMSQAATFSDAGPEADEGEADQPDPPAPAATLDELGVSRSESSRWQQVAAVPADVRREYVEETKAEKGEVSTAGLLRYARERAEPTIHHPVAPRSAAITGDPTEPAPAINGYELHEAVWNLVFEVHRIYGILVSKPAYEELANRLDEAERVELLSAVRDIASWLGGLEMRLEATGATEDEDPPGDSVEPHWSTREPSHEGEVQWDRGNRWVGVGRSWVIQNQSAEGPAAQDTTEEAGQ